MSDSEIEALVRELQQANRSADFNAKLNDPDAGECRARASLYARAATALLRLTEQNAGLREENERQRAAVLEKDAQVVARAKDLRKAREDLIWIRDELEDEGDRVYFGSTNHAEVFRDLVEKLDGWSWSDILRQSEGRDVYGDLRKAIAEIASLREQVEKAKVHLQKLLAQIDRKENEITDEELAARAFIASLSPEETTPAGRTEISGAELAQFNITPSPEAMAEIQRLEDANATALARIAAQESKDAL